MTSTSAVEPKAELHCHIEGAAPVALARELAARDGVDIADLLAGGLYRWSGFGGFLRAYDRIAALFRTEDDYRRLADGYLRRLAADGALYSEIFVSPDHAAAAGLSPDGYLAALSEGVEEARAETGIVGRMVVVGIRHHGPDSVEAAARLAAQRRHRLVTGFGLAGDERAHAPRDFAKAFDIARGSGLGLTAHAGEFAGPAAIAETLDALQVTRLGHGVRAVENAGLVRRIAEAGVTLEVCVGSNLALGVYPSLDAHPLRRLRDAGARVTLNSDDPPFFGTDLAREYALAAEIGFTSAERLCLTRHALRAAFVDEPTRARLLERATTAALGAPDAGH